MKMYIDDIRNPKGEFDIIVRSSDEAIAYMTANGCPDFTSYDHDLGGEDTSIIIIKWMIERDLDMQGAFIPDNFEWNVHSANPVGAANIEGYLNAYITSKNIDTGN